MRILMCTTVVCTLGTALHAQSVWLPAGLHQAGSAYSVQAQHVFTTMHNQAALAHVNQLSAGVYAERRFMMQALNLFAMAIALPTSSGTFGATMQSFGYSAFRQQKLGLAYGRTLGSKVSIGMQADYLAMRVPHYGSVSTVTFEAGCLLHITPQLHAGMHVFNPVGRQFYKGAQDVPIVYSAGAGYEVSADFLLSAVLVRDDQRRLTTRMMCEYRPVPQLSLQLGIATDPQQSSGGISFSWQAMRFFLSGSYHPQLGITPATAVVWQLQNKNVLP